MNKKIQYLAYMQTSSVKEIRSELSYRSKDELINICLRLSRFKKENKELLTYLLFESNDEEGYVRSIKEVVNNQFEDINTTSYYYIKKSIRKILRTIKKYIRYSSSKETEVELLLYFCEKLKAFSPSIQRNRVLLNMYQREIAAVKKKISVLHQDLQYDYQLELDALL